MDDLVQNVDFNVGPGHFNDMDKLRVISIFYTLQGEGPHAGEPAIFIRLAGCDRGEKRDCPFCDTFFSYWHGMLMTFDDIIDKFVSLLPEPTRRVLVVVTGGEPMLQDALVEFIVFAHALGWNYIQVESNGDRIPPGWLPTCAHVELVVSPKVIQGAYRKLKPHILSTADALKFVIDHRPDSPYHNVPEWAEKHGGKARVWLSPLTVYKRAVRTGEVPNAWDTDLVDHERTALNYRRVAQLCKECGYRASIQQHLFFGLE